MVLTELVQRAKRRKSRSRKTGIFVPTLMAATALASFVALRPSQADNDTRTLKLFNIHTNEHIVITFKQNGQYVPSALKELDRFLRDWRLDKEIEMDPHLFDLVWQVYQASAAQKEIFVVCGFRSPATNELLRSRSDGVAENSQHIQGRALDYYIPDVPLAKLREIGLRMQVGGVGFYPESGSPFVHMDTGSIRMWPRMNHDQLASVFPDGKTLYIPADGKPLQGYAAATAEYKMTGSVHSVASLGAPRPGQVQLAAADAVGASSTAAARSSTIVDSPSSSEIPIPRPAPDRRPQADQRMALNGSTAPTPLSRTIAGTIASAPALDGKATGGTTVAALGYAGTGTTDRRPDPLGIVTGTVPAAALRGNVVAAATAPANETRQPPAPTVVTSAIVAAVATEKAADRGPRTASMTDPLAVLAFAQTPDWSFWTAGGSTRQMTFAALSQPDYGATVAVTVSPSRTYVARFGTLPYANLRTDRFDSRSSPAIDIAEFGPRPTTLASR